MGAARAGPLRALADRLRAGRPPSLSSLRARLQQGEAFLDFVQLVEEYLPERREAILATPVPEEQIAEFARWFEERYFPLPAVFQDGEVEEYALLTHGMPVVSCGIDEDEYHVLTEWRLGYRLMFLLAEHPMEEVPIYRFGGDELRGGRVALLESCAQDGLPQELLQRARGGMAPDQLFRLVEGTRFEAVGWAARWLWHETENAFLDMTEEMAANAEEPWNPDTVRFAAAHWAQCRDLMDRMASLAEWLEADPPARFHELLDFLHSRRAEPPDQARGEI